MKKELKRSFITKGGINPHSDGSERPIENPPSRHKPIPMPSPIPSPVVDQYGNPIGKPTPEWKINLLCWGIAIMIAALIVLIGISI